MSMDTEGTNHEKRLAAESAASLVKDDMIVGLGSGTTAQVAIQELGDRVRRGLRIIGVATSEKSEALARSLGIPVSTLAEYPEIDLTIDGADEVEMGSLDLIKGRGGALLREKIVASASRQLVIVVGEEKIVDRLGSSGEVPVEVVPFAWQSTARRLVARGCKPVLRVDSEGKTFVTDGGHYIMDCLFHHGMPLQAKATELDGTVGVVEHGLFLGMTTEVHVGGRSSVRILRRASTAATKK
jgi:ribose 5-phosphate isomerase A